MKISSNAIFCAAIFSLTPSALAQDWYVSGAVGFGTQADSDNQGQTGAFTTGNIGDGSTVDVADGTPYGWTTEFDNGTVFAGEVGARFGNSLRVGVELSSTQADVDTHKNVTLGGGDIGGLDAAALAGAPDPLGVSIADLVADGRGELTATTLMVNAYYDFALEAPVTPYIGVGLGFSDVEVTYNPSGVGIIDDGETKFAYQFKAGATFDISDNLEVYGEYAYRATDDIEVNNDLFPGDLSIENQQNLFMAGIRYRFGA